MKRHRTGLSIILIVTSGVLAQLPVSSVAQAQSRSAEHRQRESKLREIVGIYDGVHPHWRDTVIITADGRYRRGNGDLGSWSYDGNTLILDWDRWGTARLVRESEGAYFDRNQKFRIIKRREVRRVVPSSPPPPVAPARKPAPSPDCGTGRDDPGCVRARDGRLPVDGGTFWGLLTALNSSSSEYDRLKTCGVVLKGKLLSTRQLAAVMALFTGEHNRLKVVEQWLKSEGSGLTDPGRALQLAETFSSNFNQRKYTGFIAKLL